MAVMGASTFTSALFDLFGITCGVILLMRLIQIIVGRRKRSRVKRAPPSRSTQKSRTSRKYYEVPYYRKNKKSWSRFGKRYPEWERWDKSRTDYVGGMFHEIVIGGFRAVYCLDYYPKNKYPDAVLSAQQIRSREYLLGLKDGRCADRSGKILGSFLLGHYWIEELKKMSLCFIPASTEELTRRRYDTMAEYALAEAPIGDGTKWIRVRQSRDATREVGKQDDTTWNLWFDREKISGKRIILVDDITTRGMSFVQCARKLMEYGAAEVTGFFFGKSVNNK